MEHSYWWYDVQAACRQPSSSRAGRCSRYRALPPSRTVTCLTSNDSSFEAGILLEAAVLEHHFGHFELSQVDQCISLPQQQLTHALVAGLKGVLNVRQYARPLANLEEGRRAIAIAQSQTGGLLIRLVSAL
ncbi:hypothetical protein TYRP_023428 [Tyrophagus putrescentiae]|nr:hypothetical protein TYRP_023428 [Tyrophagus putrescentiae]